MDVPIDLLLLGIVRLDLDCLDFGLGTCDILAREFDPSKVTNLFNIFKDSEKGCEREHDLNVIPAYINPSDLDHILSLSDLTREDLKLSLNPNSVHPRIRTGAIKIQCGLGKHRVEAGKRFFDPPDYWWTVKLYLRNDCSLDFPSKEGERYSHEADFFDGEVYRKVRQYQKNKREDLVQEWLLRLKESKRRNLRWLLQHKDYLIPFDMVLEFPGMCIGLELGNIRRHLVLHCHEELQRYLLHIYTIWRQITLNDPMLCNTVDIRTVQRLQGLAPCASVIDRQIIIEDMNSGFLFPIITNPTTRNQILEAILRLHVIIPSLKTFHENVKLLELVVQTIRRELTNCRSGSFLGSLKDIWSSPLNWWVEIREGIFCNASPAHDIDRAYLFYFQTILATLRQFSRLGPVPPLRDVKSVQLPAQADPHYQTLFARRARLFGYSNDQIEENCNLIDGDLTLARCKPVHGISKKYDKRRRWGKPCGQAYEHLQESLFIMNLQGNHLEESQEASALFIQNDFLRAFFDPCVFTVWVVVVDSQILNLNINVHHWQSLPADERPLYVASRSTSLQHTERSGIMIGRSSQTTRSTYHAERSGTISSGQRLYLSTQNTPIEIAFPAVTSQVRESLHSLRSFNHSPITTTPSPNRSYLFRLPSRATSPLEDLTLPPLDAEIETQGGSRQHGPSSNISSQTREGLQDDYGQVGLSFNLNDQKEVKRPSWEENHDTQVWESESNTTSIIYSDNGSAIRTCGPVFAAPDRTHRSYLHATKGPSQGDRYHERQLTANHRRMNKHHLRAKRPVRASRSQASGGVSKGKYFLREEVESVPRAQNARSILMPHKNVNVGTEKYILSPSSGGGRGSIVDNSSRLGSRGRSYLGSQDNTYSNDATYLLSQHGPRALKSLNKGGCVGKPSGRVRSYFGFQDDNNPQSSNGKQRATVIRFKEYNGMNYNERSTSDLDEHLKRRKGWVGMVIVDGEPKSLRLDHVVKYMENHGSSLASRTTLILVKQVHAERFRLNYRQ